MKRKIGMILTGVGAFFLALALLDQFYMAHQLIAAPLNIYQKTTLQADNATYLDLAHLKVRTGATVTAVNTTRGDVNAGDGKIAVWDSFTSVEDPATKAQLEIQNLRAAFDRRTGDLVNARGAAVGGDTSVRQRGIGLFWPIGVKKQTHQVFDPTTKRPWPAVYQGEDTVQGVKAYRFQQQVPPTVIKEEKAPASLLGLKKPPADFVGYDPKTKDVAADRVYQATVTFWVDPRTGATVNQEQKAKSSLRTKDGVERLVIGDLDLKMTEASQKELAKLSNDKAAQIAVIRSILPIGGAGLGIILVIVGVVLATLPRRQTFIPVPQAEGGADGGPQTAPRPEGTA